MVQLSQIEFNAQMHKAVDWPEDEGSGALTLTVERQISF